MMTDPISDLLIQIKNAYLAKKSQIEVPHSNMKEEIANLLKKEGYLKVVQVKSETKVKKLISIELLYENKRPKIEEIVIISKPGRRIYIKSTNILKVLGGLGMSIISTSKGLMTDREAKKKRLGGELICNLW